MAEQGMVPGNGEPAMAKATAADPSLTEGTAAFLSMDLAGNLRVKVGSISASFDATATAAAPSYTEGTANPVSQTLTGDLRTAVADGKDVALGATTGAAVITDANGSVQQYLRGLVKRWADALGAGTAAAALRTTLASDDPAVSALGATTGTKVVTDANGTIQQYLRGIITFLANALGAGTAAAANRVTLASDDPAVAVLGATTGTKVVTDANGTLQQYLRGLVSLISGTLSVAFAASATGGYSFLNIAAGQATTVVKNAAGTLHSITLNSAATATNTTIVYDHPSGVGTVIGRPNVVAATVPTTLLFDLAFANGLTIITATANGGDMTVCYK